MSQLAICRHEFGSVLSREQRDTLVLCLARRRRSVERVFSLNYESTLHAVFHIGQFDSGVADGRAAMQL